LIVVDASFLCDFLLRGNVDVELASLVASQDMLVAPDLISYEIGSVLRRLCLAGKLDESKAGTALQSFEELRIDLHEPAPLMQRAWHLRNNFSFYDACYIALSETLKVPLYTSDLKLAASQHLTSAAIFTR
jgi:predicted nucleic acid-binding protein